MAEIFNEGIRVKVSRIQVLKLGVCFRETKTVLACNTLKRT